MFQKGEAPEEIEEFRFSFLEEATPPAESVDEARKVGIKPMGIDDWDISRMLVKTGQAKSRSEANRLIGQGAVSIDDRVIKPSSDNDKALTNLDFFINSGSIIKVGKRRFVKVINTD